MKLLDRAENLRTRVLSKGLALPKIFQDANHLPKVTNEAELGGLLTPAYLDFLAFESKVFGEASPIAGYDPWLLRYSEYRFMLSTLPYKPGDTVLDLGCESNIFTLYLAYKGVKIIGVDLNPAVGESLAVRLHEISEATGKTLDYTFVAADATALDLPPASVDKVVSVSAIEHMYSERGHGDQLAVESIARVLKPGGLALITVPFNCPGEFIEQPEGDDNYGLPYRKYNDAAVQERLLSNPQLETVGLDYLDYSNPDPRYPIIKFANFWYREQSEATRHTWDWANPVLSIVYHPIVTRSYKEQHPNRNYSTVLIALRKK